MILILLVSVVVMIVISIVIISITCCHTCCCYGLVSATMLRAQEKQYKSSILQAMLWVFEGALVEAQRMLRMRTSQDPP